MIKLEYSKGQVNRAGEILLEDCLAQSEAKTVLDNWRACHVAPLNSFQRSLRLRLKKIDVTALVSQRLKRTPSILSKLKRFDGMQLARMQDIGGIRAVMKDMRRVREVEQVYKNGTRVFTRVKGGKDYINFPKDSGYRSVHMIFKCKNGYSIELQVRTYIQHAWATAVETMGTFLDHSLKSSEGPDEWLSFFSLASSAFAILESTPRVPEHDKYSADEVFELLLKKEKELDVINKLTGFRVVANHIHNDRRKGFYHLITLNMDARSASVRTFQKKDIATANKEYSLQEERVRSGENLQVVLVTSDSLAALKKAYPSYFLDAHMFTQQIEVVKRQLFKLRKYRK